MKIKINNNGFLEIERAGIMKQQFCVNAPVSDCRCGDWCPMFGEPELAAEVKKTGKKVLYILTLCKANLFGDIEDERGKGANI